MHTIIFTYLLLEILNLFIYDMVHITGLYKHLKGPPLCTKELKGP